MNDMACQASAATRADLKRATRASAIARREAMPATDRALAARAVAARGLPVPLAAGAIVAAYHPVGCELDVLALVDKLLQGGARTALPVVVAPRTALEFRAWTPGDELEPGIRNIPVPRLDARVVEPDILLVPLLAFDRNGNRLGYGAGFYDRTLERLRARRAVVAIGVAFACQEFDHVPNGPEDQRLDWVMTERAVTGCGARLGA